MPILETDATGLLLSLLFGYLVGSISFGVVVARLFGLGDLRKIGSGNTGATNVLRTGNKTAALLTLLLDGAKGAVAVLGARYFHAEDAAQVAALGAFLGHLLPIWLRFRGGKGVATFLGAVLALNWMVGLALLGTWAVFALATRTSSMGALAAASSSTIWAMAIGDGRMFYLCAALTILIFLRHRENIARLRAGTEPKIGRP